MSEFRSVGVKDQVNDDTARIEGSKLENLSQRVGYVRAILAPLYLVLVFVGAWWPTNSILWGVVKAVLFFGGLLALCLQARWMDNFVKQDVAPLFAAVYSRLVMVTATGFFWYCLFKLYKLNSYWFWFIVLVMVGGCLADWYCVKAEAKSPSKLVELAKAAYFYMVESYKQIKTVLLTILGLLAWVYVWVALRRERFQHLVDLHSSSEPREGESLFEVVHLSDLHFMADDALTGLEGANRNKESNEFLSLIKEDIQKADLIAITGDITDTGFAEEWKTANDLLFELECQANNGRLAIVPGNHDINVFMTYGKKSQEGPKHKLKLGLFGLGVFASRNIRLVRYLAFWDRWCGAFSKLHVGPASINARKYLANHSKVLNDYAEHDYAARSQEHTRRVRSIYAGTFPSALTLPRSRVTVYCMDSNSATWHPALNGIGYFNLGQIVRLFKMLRRHPSDHAAVFLMHHHLVPGFRPRKQGAKEYSRYEKGQEYFLIILNAFLFRWVLRLRLRHPAVVMHGHTHYARNYLYGRHQVFCAPSTGFGEGADEGRGQPTAVTHRFFVGADGHIRWNETIPLRANESVQGSEKQMVEEV